jgi:hypothetical protein
MFFCQTCKRIKPCCTCQTIPYMSDEWRPFWGAVYKVYYNGIVSTATLLTDKTTYTDMLKGAEHVVHLVFWDIQKRCLVCVNAAKKDVIIKPQFRAGIVSFVFAWLIHWYKIIRL